MEPWSISYLFHETQKRIQAKHPKKLANVYPSPEKCPKVLSTLIFLSFYTDYHPHPLKLPGVFHLQALERAPISLGISFPINSPPHFPCKLTILSFQLASPPSIHMDSWWAACNLSQIPKWTQNTSQDRSGAYGHDPYGVWAPESQKSALYTSWPDKPVESDANQSSWFRKIMKF